MDNPEDDFATLISYLYTLKGQKLIIDSINTLVATNVLIESIINF